MCGIAGACSRSGIDPALLPRMGDAIRHRGPDGEGYLVHGPGRDLEFSRSRDLGPERGPVTVGFAHRRLSIIDLSEASDQPMVDRERGLALAYNGELYNYLELRKTLESLGHRFETSGDTEVVLAAYGEWGPACLDRLVGMWALAILDRDREELFLTVDRFGIKPLFYAVADDSLYFGSEIKALMRVPAVRPEPNEAVVRKFLYTARVDEMPETFFSGIRRLPPAHYASVSLRDGIPAVRPRRYWSIPSNGSGRGRRRAAEEYRERLEESVRLHLRSDVPVGTCLSGGLDSSAIVCLAERLRRRGDVPRYAHSGFGYVTDDPAVSERRHMDEVVRRTGIEMNYVEVAHDRFLEALVGIIRQQDEPFGSASAAAQWFVFEAAHKRGLKVMLDGQGADEVLGGYHGYFIPIGYAHLYARRPLRYLRFNRQYRRLTGSPVLPLRQAVGLMTPAGRAATAEPAPPGLPEGSLSPLLTPELRGRFQPSDYAVPHFQSIDEILAANTGTYSLPSLLRFEDRNSMAHSVEARVPFLDHRLVEFTFSLPDRSKVDGVRTKAVLRDAMEGILPEPIRVRSDKIGFRAEPTATWDLARRLRASLLKNETEYEQRWFDPAGLKALLDGDDRSDEAEFMLWRVLNTKLWLRTFWGDGEPSPVE